MEQVNFMQVVPDSHFWTSIESLIEYLKYQKETTNTEYLIKGLNNSLKRDYNIKKINNIKEPNY